MSLGIEIDRQDDSGLFDSNILNYNCDYFSILINLAGNIGRPTDAIIHRNGKWMATQDPSTFSWAKPMIEALSIYETRTWIIINGSTDALGRVRLSDRKQALLKDGPIAIFLYEPLFFLKDDGSRSFWRSNSPEQNDFVAAELDSVLEFNQKHGGNLNITIYACDHNVQRLIQNHPKYHSLKVKTFDIFLFQYTARNRSSLGPMRFNFTKTAICMNFRYDFFREIVVAFLRERNYHLRSFLTYYHTHDPKVFSWLPFSLSDWTYGDVVKQGIEKMQPELPYYLEAKNVTAVSPAQFEIPDIKSGANLRREKEIQKYYENAFLSLVNETRFFNYCPNISEKTVHPFYYFRPTLLIAPPGTLQYIKELGFKTFNDFWDESYDFELNHARRLERIFGLVDSIFALPKAKLESMLWDMQPILYHNRLHLLDYALHQGHFLKNER